MTLMKRFACIGVVLLLLCTVLAGCVSQEEELPPEDPVLTAIKAEWNNYFVDRTKDVSYICMNLSSLSSFIPMIRERETIDEVLDICETLDVESLQVDQNWGDKEPTRWTDMLVAVCTSSTDPDADNISIIIDNEGRATFIVVIDGNEYRAYAEGWNTFEAFREYRWVHQTGNETESFAVFGDEVF